MKTLGEILLQTEAGEELLMGNHALVRAMLESGTKVVTSYPGSPTPEIGEAILSLPRAENPLYFEFSVNEKVALEVAFGAAINGHTSCVFFKSVGLNVASDSFVQLSLMNIPGGMVIVLGDDPGANSSQNEQDNRHYARLAYLPVFEPKDPQEAYAMYKEAVEVARQHQMAVLLRLTTHVCHAREIIHFSSLEEAEERPDGGSFSPDIYGPYIPIAQDVFPMKRRALERLKAVQTYSEDCPFHELIDYGNTERGIITAGLPYLSLLEVVQDAQEKVNILRLGMIHPLPESLLLHFLERHREVKVLEELDDVLEQKIKALAYDHLIQTRIRGKEDIEDWLGEYTPDKVGEVLRRTWPHLLPEFESKGFTPALPRPPQMCPGCGHRSAFYAIKKALGSGVHTVADIGCHTLGFLPPYEMGQVLLSMGHASSTAAGLSLFQKEKHVVAFLGDSTLFHAGLPGIMNAVYNGHNITLIIMENGTTAMTGHQDHPGTGKNVQGDTKKVAIAPLLETMGVEHIFTVDTYDQEKLTKYVQQALQTSGFSVVIARHPCMLKFTRQQKKRGRKIRQVEITEGCQQLHDCVARFACPSFQRGEDGTVTVHEDLCIGDGSCIQTCSLNAIAREGKGEEG